jgi:hypothetical protein
LGEEGSLEEWRARSEGEEDCWESREREGRRKEREKQSCTREAALPQGSSAAAWPLSSRSRMLLRLCS